jgi:hypothetical protein
MQPDRSIAHVFEVQGSQQSRSPELAFDIPHEVTGFQRRPDSVVEVGS